LKESASEGYGSVMVHKPNPRQLVLRRDTATGLTLVGWAADLPVGRFQHLELIGELADNILPDSKSACYDAWQTALHHARQANRLVLAKQVRQHQAKGWYLVPFELAQDRQAMHSDSVGNYAAAAMQLHYQLTHNRKQAWVNIQGGTVVHVRARYPKKALDELTYQVWYNVQLQQLNLMEGSILEGNLISCESGLWFAAKQAKTDS
jgi:hypothetical protein